MKTLTFRKLKPEEIELRVGATNDSGFSLLLYKTARVDANILDETVGTFGWTKRFYQVKNTMICEIGIFNEDTKEWVTKGDAGDESNTEAIKGEASDSFKRAGFAWGIGRELYTSPFIWVSKDNNNDPKKSHYQVKEIDYKDNEISKLVIVNEKTGQVVFSKGSSTKVSKTTDLVDRNESVPSTSKNTTTLNDLGKGIGDNFLEESEITQETRKKITDITGMFDAERYNNFKTYLKNVFNADSVAELTELQGKKLLKALGGK